MTRWIHGTLKEMWRFNNVYLKRGLGHCPGAAPVGDADLSTSNPSSCLLLVDE